MKKADQARQPAEELRPEYDFSKMPGRVRGKYAAAFRRGTNLVRLDPDVAKAFSSDKSVNEALRAVLKAAAAIAPAGQPANKSLRSEGAARAR